MKALLYIAKSEFDTILIYRVSFIIWRLRAVMQLITLYFLWVAMLPKNATFHGYDQGLMVTYTIGTSFINALVLSSKTDRIGGEINDGTLSTYLLKPINFFAYWLARDVGDKGMNIIFSLIELSLFFLIFHPPFFIQTHLVFIILFIVALILGLIIFFFFSVLLGFIGFWSAEVWGPRFIFFQILSFFAGGLFPLDILPKPLFAAVQFLPFSYLLFFPLKIYLGQLTIQAIISGLIIAAVWAIIMYFVVNLVWQKGLTAYSAQGN